MPESCPTYLSSEEIRARADLRSLIAEMRAAFAAGQASDGDIPRRTLILRERPFAAFGAMPAHSGAHGLFVTKVAALVEQGPAAPRPSVQATTLGPVQALVLAFSAQTGTPLAILEGATLTALKCEAITGLVTDLCAAGGARTLGILGAGVQARSQIRGVCAVRPIDEIRLFSRSPEGAARLAAEAPSLAGRPIRIVLCASAEEAAEGVEIVSTATTTASPLFSEQRLAERVHVNCLGAHTPSSREVSREFLESALLVVEDRETAIAEAGEVHRRALEVEELVRRAPEPLGAVRTVFSSTGHAFLDLLATAHVLERSGIHERP